MKNLKRKDYCLSCEHILSEQGYVFIEDNPAVGLPSADKKVYCKRCMQPIEPAIEIVANDYATTITALKNPKLKVIAFVAPSVRSGIGEIFNIDGDCQNKIVTALKLLGVHEVFSMNFGADLTITEESEEFLQRLKSNSNLPMLTSCCPAWYNYVKSVKPSLLPYMSTCKSPQQMMGAIINNYYTKHNNISPTDIFILSVVPCIAKKVERIRPNINSGIGEDVDACITTIELAELIKQNHIDFTKLKDSQFDELFKDYSGYSSGFGAAGGVSKSVILNAFPDAKLTSTKNGNITEIKVETKSQTFYCAHIEGVTNIANLENDIISGKCKYKLIEVMACTGGCIAGPGQPKNIDISHRKQILDNATHSASIINAQNNTIINKLYSTEITPELRHKWFHEER